MKAVVDPGFPRRGHQPKGGRQPDAPSLDLPMFYVITAHNEVVCGALYRKNGNFGARA